MKKRLTYTEMQDLINCSLYVLEGETATPNYRYMKEDAPVYKWDPQVEWPEGYEDGVFVLVEADASADAVID